MSIKENAKTGKISTIIGVVIVTASIVSVFIEPLNIDWTNASVGMGVGLALIGLVKK